MNQIPMMPYQNLAMAQPVQQPNYNAVKIDIINPSVGTPSCNSQYAQPTMPYYNYPQQQVYTYPQAQQTPYYPPVADAVYAPTGVNVNYPQAQIPQQPVAQLPQPQINQVPQQPVQQPAAVAQQPQVTQAQSADAVANATQKCPQGQVAVCVPADQAEAIRQQVAQNQTIQQQNINVPPTQTSTEVPPVVPQPQVSQPQSAQVVKEQPEVVASETIAPQLDLNSFIARFANPDFEVQAAAMEDVATLVKDDPAKATELVDAKVFDSLAGILSFNSNNVAGPTAEQIAARQKIMEGKDVSDAERDLANTMSVKEQAERNKSYALYTTALLQKLYSDEVAKLTNNVLPLTELPNAVAVVDNLKDNPNPMVRGSAIEALSYLQRPEYKKDLETVFSIAKNDVDPRVAQTAQEALERLAQV